MEVPTGEGAGPAVRAAQGRWRLRHLPDQRDGCGLPRVVVAAAMTTPVADSSGLVRGLMFAFPMALPFWLALIALVVWL